MSLIWLLGLVLAIAAVGYALGRTRALSSTNGDIRKLHSLPSYYGANVALKSAIPALLVLVVWLVAQPLIVSGVVSSDIPDSAIPEGSSRGLVMSEVKRVAAGLDGAVAAGTMSASYAASAQADMDDVTKRMRDAQQITPEALTPEILTAGQRFRAMVAQGKWAMTAVVLALAVAGAFWGLRESHAEFRARNTVERVTKVLLIAAASLAILTTVGIVLSLVFNTYEFFTMYPPLEFFFGTTWAPSFSGRGGSSELGIVPLLWGTFYISIVALAVAVPIGLFSAIYLSEYAGPKVRAIAKPLLEVLAGIPTIVYGLFALLTVGPLLVSIFGKDGFGWMQSGTAVMTAGIVMGIMLIPFVSSLSDDIINAVPQSLRDGSYGLGATKSETIKQVVLPAALPGIVGAILLAASRAIGETMIVVLGAGAAARLSLNPFEAMTTVTAKIVSQLTGDTDFSSPEMLVAFALGMTLFVVTLGLNIFALYIVRKYREQYE
ncbi:phosphate ABC transporter permease subunit PstC [Tropicibacter naphthalenivorans]|uniref:Phosphate transport system permease protein n=1 Tax=Tropicibacter naphthalenivorans TaxID=441103 RepID=A0A0N7LZE2_9RHOB|nr:phosphate ABC transporter permease subunit PstC [Tropicibacter naphthalenivorans]CUH77417.1 Phosphate transport system permease protein PstC [Tropicibacter naphthalenivorans]SMC58162.1 phosphate ABC transporter membrane protein 1, PhoT family [Tropicibacter naphthalenivorans]